MKYLDFTQERKGQHRGYTIAVCRVCGRKGRYYPSWVDKRGERQAARWDHKAEFDGLFLTITDHCVEIPAFDWLRRKVYTQHLVNGLWVNRTPIPSDTESWCEGQE